MDPGSESNLYAVHFIAFGMCGKLVYYEGDWKLPKTIYYNSITLFFRFFFFP
jgi:hypothetical protein